MIKVEARSCHQLTTVNLERQEIINCGVTMMDRTVVRQEISNGGVTTVLAGLLRDRKLAMVE
jgi:hypothetical protein